MPETFAGPFEWQKPSVGWMSRYFGASFSSINSIFARFCAAEPVSLYICHIKVANAPKHTFQVALDFVFMHTVSRVLKNDYCKHNLNENWPCIYPLPLAHLFPITFRHSNIETEFHIKVTSTAERFIHERNIAAQAFVIFVIMKIN